MARQKVVEAVSVVREVKTPVKIDKDRYVDVMNITKFGLTYRDRLGLEYRWEKEFDIVGMPFGELQTILSSKSGFLKNPWMFILEDDVIDALRLRGLYETLIDPRDLESFFELSDKKIIEKLEKSPMSIKEMIVRKARERVDQLTVSKKNAIEQSTGAQLVIG